MTGTTIKKNVLTILLVLLSAGALFAQRIAPAEASGVVVPYDDTSAPGASEIIFSNLGSPDDLYNSNPDLALPVAGRDAYNNVTEEWFAVQFTPEVDVRAKVLLAAVGSVSGAKRVKLGIYNNDRFTESVGRPVFGGEGSTSQIPDLGSCCQLTRVRLPGDGVPLAAHKRYWLVASADDTNAPTFYGGWYLSNLAKNAYYAPPSSWSYPSGAWPAAEIRGSRMQSASSIGRQSEARPDTPPVRNSAPNAQITIFSNLDRPRPTSTTATLVAFTSQGTQLSTLQRCGRHFRLRAKTNFHAKTLAAAIGYKTGTKKVNLSIYSDNDGAVGTLLPNGQGSTTDIPDFEECCALAQVTLPEPGAALTAGGHYWLVASPDDVNAPDFEGLWQSSNLAFGAYTQPENFTNWTTFTGLWLAAGIRGTNP